MQTYGAKVNSEQLVKLIRHQIQSNRLQMRKGNAGTPLCIWGQHGIGKTQIVRHFAKQHSYKIVSLAPAQFEEMGDLLGMPSIEGQQTVFKKPSWVPDEFGPGILLLDDFNRADERIIKGLMPLLQDGRMISWSLPPDWHIVLTANPDLGDYSVTPLDQAILTRMLHVELVFDVLSWSHWARSARIPNLLANFVLLYPEMIQDQRTTTRTMVQFFESLQGLTNIFKQKELVKVLAKGFLEDETVSQFMTYLKSRDAHLPSAATILDTTDFEEEVTKPMAQLLKGKAIRTDILMAIWDRLERMIKSKTEALNKDQLSNLASLLKMEDLPEDIRKHWANQLVAMERKEVDAMFSEGDWGSFLL